MMGGLSMIDVGVRGRRTQEDTASFFPFMIVLRRCLPRGGLCGLEAVIKSFEAVFVKNE